MNSSEDKDRGLLIVLSAPSGAGKTSICRRLLDICPNLSYSVSFTTRAPRPGEEEGKDYYFLSEQVFREKIARGEFVEWVENYGQLYGTAKTSIHALMKRGCDLLIDLEPRGAKELKNNFPGAVSVFVLPPTLEELKSRLIKRGFEGQAAMKTRLDKAREECKEVYWYDYVIFNDRLEDAVCRLHAIYVAEKSRRERMVERIKDLLE